MEKYVVNIKTDDNGIHAIHTESCIYLPEYYNRVQLGWYEKSTSALSSASIAGYSPVTLCYYCCNV